MVYKVPFVNYPLQYHNMKAEIDAAISECLEGGDLIMRRQLKEFEDNMAAFVGTKYAIGCNSGTDALRMSLMALGVGPGDEVITVAHTFVATISVIKDVGAKPVLVDIGDDMNMDVSLVEDAISERTKAIIPVHLNGRCCDMGTLGKISTDYGIPMVEDACQALGASYRRRKAGSFGETGCFSFYPAKILGCYGDGGMLTTDNEAIAEKIRLYRDHGVQRGTGRIRCFGFNSRLDNIQAAILNAKLKHLPEWIERRRQIAALYSEGLKTLVCLGFIMPSIPDKDDYFFDVFTNYVVQVPSEPLVSRLFDKEPAYITQRDKLVAYLKEHGVETLISWAIPLHQQKRLRIPYFDLPLTNGVSDRVLSLPMYPELTDDQVNYVIGSIHSECQAVYNTPNSLKGGMR